MPTRDTAWPNGTPCWIDYSTTDVEAARHFYAAVLGWSYVGGDPAFGGYLIGQTKGLDAGGIGPAMDPSAPPRWTTYFAADDADATATKVAAAGGSIVAAPMDVGPMGRLAIATDPQGQPFGLWQAGQNTGVRIYNEPGSLVWNEAAFDDPAAARAFYAAVFGFRFTDAEGLDDYTTFATDGGPLGGISRRQPGGTAGWSTCFSVASADAAVAATEAAGGKVIMAAQDTSFGRFAVVTDPWGAPFSVMQELPGSA
jgi:uncharacterized protein